MEDGYEIGMENVPFTGEDSVTLEFDGRVSDMDGDSFVSPARSRRPRRREGHQRRKIKVT